MVLITSNSLRLFHVCNIKISVRENFCCICGTYELHMMAIDPRMQRSMCLGCYNVKIKLDNQIDKMLKPYKLTEEIFITREKDERPITNLIPISQITF